MAFGAGIGTSFAGPIEHCHKELARLQEKVDESVLKDVPNACDCFYMDLDQEEYQGNRLSRLTTCLAERFSFGAVFLIASHNHNDCSVPPDLAI